MKIGDKVKVELEMTVSYIGEQDNPEYSFVCGNVDLDGMYAKTDGSLRKRTAYVSGVPLKFVQGVQ